MKKMETGLEFYQGGNDFLDGYCAAAGVTTVGRAVALKLAARLTLKAMVGGPVGWFLAASDAVCIAYDISSGFN